MQRRIDRPNNTGLVAFKLPSDRDTRDTKLGSGTVVALRQDPERVTTFLLRELARSRTGSTFKAMAVHPGAASYIPLADPPAAGRLQCVDRVLGLDMKALHIVQPAVGCLGHDRVPERTIGAVLHHPTDCRIVYGTDAQGVRDQDGGFQDTRFFQPMSSSHVPVAVSGIESREHWLKGRPATGQNGGDSSTNRTLPHDELSFAGDESCVADFDPGHVSDRVQGTWSPVQRDTEIARSRFCLSEGDVGGEGPKQ